MIFGDGSFFDAMRRGMKNIRDTVKQIADPIIELRQMANRVAQPEASTGMFNGGMVIPYGPISMRNVPAPYNPGPGPRRDEFAFSKGGVVKGKKAPKAKAKKAPKKTKK